MTTEREELLIPRIPITAGLKRPYMGEYQEEEIAKYNVGDIYIKSFSTTSPPAFVTNEYRVTKKDREGMWGVLIDGSVREMDISEV